MSWIGVDLDGTLAEWHRPRGQIGNPVPAMVARVNRWRSQGREVRIFTARVSSAESRLTRLIQRMAIMVWCKSHLGCILPVTAEKDFEMESFYDDRAVAVERNTGRLMGGNDA